ncbi:MAG: hypothetical protein IJ704_04550 [Bacilli bacterium]|nr:hypothetical protein [Bacilli bacterium]
MTKDSLLKMLHSFHFDALSKEPFLCEFEDGYGLYYSIKHKEFGKLSRVFYSTNPLEVKNFLALYRFYLENESFISVSFDDYKILSPHVSFFYQEKKLYLDNLEHIREELSRSDETDAYFRKVLRSIQLLEQVIISKIKLQSDCHQSVLKFSKEYYKLIQKMESLKHQYNSKYSQGKIESIAETSFYDFTNEFHLIQKDFRSFIHLDDATFYIHDLLDFLLKIDESVTFIQDKYELLCYPLKIDLVRKQCSYLESLIQKKSSLFSKKVNLGEDLRKMERSHSFSHVISFKNYEKNEHQRIKEKYKMINDIDIRTVGDFLVEFDNLHVMDVPFVSTKKKKRLTSSAIIASLEEGYSNRSVEEQATLALYHSILKPILYYMDTHQEQLANDYIQDFMEDLKLISNSVIRLRYFKSILTTNVEECKKSIVSSLKKIHEIPCDCLMDDFIVYFKDQKKLSSKSLLIASSKKNMAPCQLLGEQDVLYVCTLKKGSCLYYVPKEITYDVDQENTLVVKSGNPYFVIPLQKNSIKGEKSDIITVVEYKGKKNQVDDFCLVQDIKSVKVSQIRKIEIERNA